jgi:hypothetical protein
MEISRLIDLSIKDLNNPVLQHFDKCKHRHMFQDLNLIGRLQATCKSKLIECEYFIRITCDYESCLCCSSPPTIDIPIVIYIPNIDFNYERHRPDNWNPQMMPNFQVQDINYQTENQNSRMPNMTNNQMPNQYNQNNMMNNNQNLNSNSNQNYQNNIMPNNNHNNMMPNYQMQNNNKQGLNNQIPDQDFINQNQN